MKNYAMIIALSGFLGCVSNSDKGQRSKIAAIKSGCKNVSSLMKTEGPVQNIEANEFSEEFCSQHFMMDVYTESNDGSSVSLQSESSNIERARLLIEKLIAKKFSQTAHVLNALNDHNLGMFLNIEGSLSLAGIQQGYELVRHGNEIALFCSFGPVFSPFASTEVVTAGALVSAGAVVTSKDTCKESNDYTGGFLDFGVTLGVSELVRGGVTFSYNVGVSSLYNFSQDLFATLKDINGKYGKLIIRNGFDSIVEAVGDQWKKLESEEEKLKFIPFLSVFGEFMKVSLSYQGRDKIIKPELQRPIATYSRAYRSYQSQLVLDSPNVEFLQRIYESGLKFHFLKFTERLLEKFDGDSVEYALLDEMRNLFDRNLSGCDSTSFGGGVGIASPDSNPARASLDMAYTYYSIPLGAKIDLSKAIKSVESLNKVGFMRLNRFDLSSEEKKMLLSSYGELVKDIAKFMGAVAILQSNRIVFNHQCVNPALESILGKQISGYDILGKVIKEIPYEDLFKSSVGDND